MSGFFQEKLVPTYDIIMNHMLDLYWKQSACLKTLRLMSEYICPLRQTTRDLLERYYLDNKDIWAAYFDISVMNCSVCFLSGLTQTCYGFERNKLAVHIMWSIILRLAIEWNIIIWVVAINFWISTYQNPMKPVNNCHFLFFVDIFPNRELERDTLQGLC